MGVWLRCAKLMANSWLCAVAVPNSNSSSGSHTTVIHGLRHSSETGLASSAIAVAAFLNSTRSTSRFPITHYRSMTTAYVQSSWSFLIRGQPHAKRRRPSCGIIGICVTMERTPIALRQMERTTSRLSLLTEVIALGRKVIDERGAERDARHGEGSTAAHDFHSSLRSNACKRVGNSWNAPKMKVTNSDSIVSNATRPDVDRLKRTNRVLVT